MGFEEDQEQEFAEFPEAIRSAHAHSSHHRSELLAGTTCACFFCCSTFPVAEITEWTDKVDVDGDGQTALCPKCGCDSVLGDRADTRSRRIS